MTRARNIFIPELTEVKSTAIKALGWREDSLYVKFCSGSIYEYKDVPEETYKAFLRSEHKGWFFHDEIIAKDYNYDYLV